MLPIRIARQLQRNTSLNRYNVRFLQQSRASLFINPLLPFDVLEELENDDAKVDKEKLEKQKKTLLRQKKLMKNKLEKEGIGFALEEGGKSESESTNSKGGKGSELPKNKSKEDGEHNNNERRATNYTSGETDSNQHKDSKQKHPIEEPNADSRHPTEASNGPDSITHQVTTAYEVGLSTKFRQDHGAPAEGESIIPGAEKQTSPSGSGNGGDDGNGAVYSQSKDQGNDPNSKKDSESEFEEPEVEEPSKLRQTFDSFSRFIFKCLETIGITLSSVGVLGLSGLLYHKFYGTHVLDKMEMAFEKGDPAYQLTIHNKTNKRSESDTGDDDDDEDLSSYWVTRPQQQLVDDIVSGKIRGRYYLLVGEKGTGKTTIIMEAMKKIDGSNVAIFDAHADPEIFRIRLGKALNYAYNEDYIGSLFSMRGPRDTTALLDIERAFNKLEELAIKNKLSGKRDKPLILIINNSHLIKENEEGVKLLELLQQKAESLGGSELVTMIFNSDDYWVYEKLKRLGTRLELINVRDFNRTETISVLKFIRNKAYPAKKYPQLVLGEEQCHQIYDLIGGRPQHIGQVARHRDTIKACHEIIDREKTWFLNQCGLLGEEMDDDVMEHGKFSGSAMLLMREFVEMDREKMNTLIAAEKPEASDLCKSHHLPELPLWRARQIMTRPDYIQEYDNLNIFTVDSDSRVRADSVPMMRAFHEIASQPHFDQLLDESLERVAAIESLGRTREIVSKDLTEGATYNISKKDGTFSVQMLKQPVENGGDPDFFLEEIGKNEHKQRWWKQRRGGLYESYLPARTTGREKESSSK